MRAGSDYSEFSKPSLQQCYQNITNHYEDRKNVKVYPLLILIYLLATGMQDRISEEMGQYFFIYCYYIICDFSLSIEIYFIRKTATILEKNRTCISRFTWAVLFLPLLPSFLSVGWCPPILSKSISSSVPGPSHFPPFWDCIPCLVSCIFCLQHLPLH